MISVCITVRNQSRFRVGEDDLTPFPNCVGSLVTAMTHPHSLACELIVADRGSEDWPLEDWLPEKAAPLPVRHLRLDANFSRCQGRNCAARTARGDKLLFIEAETLISSEIVRRGLRYLREGKAYFPVPYTIDDTDQAAGNWASTAFLTCFLDRETYSLVNGWSLDDSDGSEFFARVNQLTSTIREEVPGFYRPHRPRETCSAGLPTCGLGGLLSPGKNVQ